MRRSLLFVFMLAPIATLSAQGQGGDLRSVSTTGSARAEHVVARLMSFDRNNDGRVAREELNERMQNLIARADSGGDGALDATEVRALAAAPPAPVQIRGFQGGGYSFGDTFETSSRAHFEGAVADLRLDAERQARALAVVKTFIDTLEGNARTTVLNDLGGLLTAEQLADFTQQLDSQDRLRERMNQMVHTVTSNGATAQKVFFRVRTPDLAQMVVTKYGVPGERGEKAVAAVERFKTQMRPGEAERAELVEQMTGILTDQERQDLGAALGRRPLVKGGGVVFASTSREKAVTFESIIRSDVPPLVVSTGVAN